MRSPASSPPAHRWRAYAWGVLAALTCPCHLPVLVIVLAGTTAGAFLSAHWGVVAVALVAVFGVSVLLAWRAAHPAGS
ncbi:broad-spectrum mercury transporter MerE [Pseudomonas knackmussii]|jgi:mercuric ion transport protein|uniref:Broad-spectrum mercury transporter MerE n=1 Tax=Pseudomonas knackmussii TaxID=65741 RepID=A0ABY4KKR3_9PSED|nr:broad-spectrum mercury transporter MerE [Pseudomonas knackmussii]UPQ81410.1 broad-spectrum mercury transporter MerE [Pseudomonas knackmussii]